jgi:hypothetical protein
VARGSAQETLLLLAEHVARVLIISLQGDRPTTICAGSKVFSVISATLGMEGGFKANVLLLSIAVFQCMRVHTLIAGEEIIHRYFRCHAFCLLSDVFGTHVRKEKQSQYLESSKMKLPLPFISSQTVAQ